MPVKTNLERQRAFQQRHPGYDRRRKARGRVARQRELERLRAEWREALLKELMPTIPIPTVKMLPAPVEVLVFPALNDLEAIRVNA